jgi:hypothetical protein
MGFAKAKQTGDAHEIVAARAALIRNLHICCSSGARIAPRGSATAIRLGKKINA